MNTFLTNIFSVMRRICFRFSQRDLRGDLRRRSARRSADKAFILIELIVVMGIIAILSGIVLINYRTGQEQLALQRATNKLASDIRRVQEMAMSARESNGVPPRYGVQFTTTDPDYYILFADLNDNGKYEPGDDDPIETTTFEQGVSIDQLFIGDSLSSTTKIWITFEPPDPIIEIRNPAATGFSIAKVQLIGANQTKTIEVNEVGRIEID